MGQATRRLRAGVSCFGLRLALAIRPGIVYVCPFRGRQRPVEDLQFVQTAVEIGCAVEAACVEGADAHRLGVQEGAGLTGNERRRIWQVYSVKIPKDAGGLPRARHSKGGANPWGSG